MVRSATSQMRSPRTTWDPIDHVIVEFSNKKLTENHTIKCVFFSSKCVKLPLELWLRTDSLWMSRLNPFLIYFCDQRFGCISLSKLCHWYFWCVHSSSVFYVYGVVTYLVCHTCCLDYLRACVCHMRTTGDLSRVSYRLLWENKSYGKYSVWVIL